MITRCPRIVIHRKSFCLLRFMTAKQHRKAAGQCAQLPRMHGAALLQLYSVSCDCGGNAGQFGFISVTVFICCKVSLVGMFPIQTVSPRDPYHTPLAPVAAAPAAPAYISLEEAACHKFDTNFQIATPTLQTQATASEETLPKSV